MNAEEMRKSRRKGKTNARSKRGSSPNPSMNTPSTPASLRGDRKHHTPDSEPISSRGLRKNDRGANNYEYSRNYSSDLEARPSLSAPNAEDAEEFLSPPISFHDEEGSESNTGVQLLPPDPRQGREPSTDGGLVEAVGVLVAEDPAEQVLVERQKNEQLQEQLKKQKKIFTRFIAAMILVMCIVAIIVGVVIGTKETPKAPPLTIPSESPSVIPSESPSLVPSSPPSLISSKAPSITPTESPSSEPSSSSAPTSVLDPLYNDLPSYTISSLENTNSPQYRAWLWLENHQNMSNLPEWRKKQLFGLASFYYSFGGPSWPPVIGNATNTWLDENTEECHWFPGSGREVACNHLGEFEVLHMEGLQLSELAPSIPAEIEFLTSLDSLSLPNNNISGRLENLFAPEWFVYEDFKLPRVLNLANNRLDGALPWELTFNPFIEVLILANNSLGRGSSEFDSQIPSFGGIPTFGGRLTELRLENNFFRGQVPNYYHFQGNISKLHLGNNELSGTIWSELGTLHELVELDLSNNLGLSGAIPSELALLSNLRYLDLSGINNGFIFGSIPEGICHLQNTSCFYGGLDGNTSACFIDFDCTEYLCGCDCSCNNQSTPSQWCGGNLLPETPYLEPMEQPRPLDEIFGGELGFVTEDAALRHCPNLWNAGFESFAGCLAESCSFRYEEACESPGNVQASAELPDCESIASIVLETYGKPGCCLAHCISNIIDLSKCVLTSTSNDHDCGIVDSPSITGIHVFPITIAPLNFYFAVGDYRFNDRMAWEHCANTREAFMRCASQSCLNYETLCPSLGRQVESAVCPECALVRDLLVITYGSTEDCCLIEACVDELESMSKCMLTMAELYDCGNYDMPP